MAESFWTDDLIEQARALYIDKGLSASIVAAAVGAKSRNAVIGIAHRKNWERSPGIGHANSKAAHQKRAMTPRNPEKPRLAVQGPPAPRIAPSELPRGANPKPWMDRRVRECAWPVEGEGTAVLSCCAPVTVRKDGQFHSYCAAHLLLGTVRTISKPRAPYEPNVIRVPARVR